MNCHDQYYSALNTYYYNTQPFMSTQWRAVFFCVNTELFYEGELSRCVIHATPSIYESIQVPLSHLFQTSVLVYKLHL